MINTLIKHVVLCEYELCTVQTDTMRLLLFFIIIFNIPAVFEILALQKKKKKKNDVYALRCSAENLNKLEMCELSASRQF